MESVIQNTIWIELLKLGVFAIFVSSIIEVVKGISTKGFFGIFKDLFNTLVHNKPMCAETIQTINFTIALLCCYAFDYGVISKLIEPGQALRVGLAGWIDYIGTASLVYSGADALFKKFSSMKKVWDVERTKSMPKESEIPKEPEPETK